MAGVPYSPTTVFDPSQVVRLRPADAKAVLGPKTMVQCINRGPHTLVDMYDAHEYVIPPFAVCEVEYEVAAHIKARKIVPGTRNPRPDDPSYPQSVSWIAINGVDPVEALKPFSDAFLAMVGEKVEGLNRDLLSKADRDVTIARTSELRATLPGAGESTSFAAMAAAESGFDANAPAPSFARSGVVQGFEGGSQEMRDMAETPVTRSDASEAVAAGLAGGWTPPDQGSIPDRSAPAPAEVAAHITTRKGSGKTR